MPINHSSHSCMTRRHQQPTCTCAACAAFDQSVTLPLRPVHTEGVIMTALDTETGERFTYFYRSGILHKMPVPPTPRQVPQPKRETKRPVRTLLHDLVMETIEQSVQRHPFFWLCVSRLLH